MYQKSEFRQQELYGITGRKGHGKDTFARLVCEAGRGTFQVVHFAKVLKQMAARLFRLTDAQMNDPTFKESSLAVPIHMDHLLEAMRQETGLMELQPAGKIATSPREVMQFFGTEYVRRAQGDYWIQRLLGEVKHGRRLLVPDTRFPDEADALRSVGGRIIKVLRIGSPEQGDTHASETETDKIEPDLLLGIKTGDLSLARRVATLIALGKFKAAAKYDYRIAQIAIAEYLAGKSLEEAARILGHKHPYPLHNLLDYYGIDVRKRSGSRVPHKVIDGHATKWCSRCTAWKPLTDFNASSKSWDCLGGLCRPCASETNKERYQKYEREDSLKAVFSLFKKSAHPRGLTFDLTFEVVQALWDRQSGRCYYSGLPLVTELNSPNKVSIDRLNSSLGYTEDNVVLCTSRVNLMKRDMTVDEFREIIRTLHGYFVANHHS